MVEEVGHFCQNAKKQGKTCYGVVQHRIILELALKGNLSQVSSHDLDRRSNENNKLNWRTSGTYTKSHGGIFRAKNGTSRF